MADKFYRLRIRNAADSADELLITSVRGGTNPYALEPPQGDGQSFDPLTGEVMTGAYTFSVIDAALTSTNRVLTGVLADANARQQLLSRKAFVETSSDGAAWSILVPGYVTAVRLPSALAAEIQVGQTRRIEATKTIFRDNSGYFNKMTSIIGGPVVGGWGSIPDYGGWRVRVQEINATYAYVHLKLISGFDPRRAGKQFGSSIPQHVLREIWDLTQPERRFNYEASRDPVFPPWRFPGLTYRAQHLDGTVLAQVDALPSPRGVLQGVGAPEGTPVPSATGGFWLDWAAGAAISVGQELNLYLYADAASEANPLHVYDHPIDIIEQLWIGAGVAYDASVLPALKTLLGPDLKLMLRITDSPKLGAFLREVIYGPFGLATRIDTQGRQVLFSTRIKSSTVPAAVIALADLADPSGTVFDLDEGTVANRVTIRSERFDVATTSPEENAPPDGVQVTTVTVSVENGDPAAGYGEREITYTIPGSITQANSPAGVDLKQFATGVAREIFDRFGRGAIASDLNCLAGVTALLGDEVQLDLPHLPNAVVGQSPVSQRGGIRIVQIVRRTETPHGPVLRVVDSGTSAQASAAPTITIAAGGDNRKVAIVTITNAATLAAAGLLVRLEIGSGSVQPSAGALLTIADPATQTTVTTPSLDAGTRVWVRARSERVDRRPSAWSAWANVQLTALNAVTLLAVSAENTADRSKRLLTWAVGSNASDIPVEVLTNKAGEVQRLVATLPAGSTQYELRGLDAATRTATVRHREAPPHAGVSVDASVSVVTSAGQRTLAAPTEPSAFAGSLDPNGALVLDGTYGLEVTATEIPSGVEVQVAVGAGAFATAEIVSAVQGGRTRWTGRAPNDGQTRKMRVRHVASGATDSAWTAEVTVAPWGVTSPETPLPPEQAADINGWIDLDVARGAGLGRGLVEAALRRSGLGGVFNRAAAFIGFDVYDRAGTYALINAELGRATADLDGPTGIGMDVVERGGNKGDQALDASNIAVAAAVDFTRAYPGKNLANVPDDATSDRRAATLNQKTGGDRGYTGLDSTSKLVTGVTSAATAADGLTGITSKRAAVRAAGVGTTIAAHERRRGSGGTVSEPFTKEPIYSADGARPLINTITREILSDLAIGAGVRGASDVAFGGTVKFQTNRHNEAGSGIDGASISFGTSYEQIPETRALPLTYRTPAAGNTIEVKAINVTVSGATIRAKEISGATSTARTDDFASTLNGTPQAAGITIGAPSSEAFCNLSNATTTATTYKGFFDVNTTSKSGGGFTRVTAYKNDGIASTTRTQVGQNSYDDGVNLTGEKIEFSATLGANFDVRLVVTYSAGTPSVNATVVADRVDYDAIVPGTETAITNVAGGSVLLQAVEKS